MVWGGQKGCRKLSVSIKDAIRTPQQWTNLCELATQETVFMHMQYRKPRNLRAIVKFYSKNIY